MFKESCFVLIWFTLINLRVKCTGQDMSKAQRYNPNLDFLKHESGTTASNINYESLFPSLPSKDPSSTAVTEIKPSGKRDYVAPNYPILKPFKDNLHIYHMTNPISSTASTPLSSPNGKRDYVASTFQTLKPHSANENKGQTTSFISYNNTQQTNAKRDYVASQFTTPSPGLKTNGKVKDLINFFGGQGNNKPSFSSVVGGHNAPSTLRTTQAVPTASTSTIGINRHGAKKPSSTLTQMDHTTATPSVQSPVFPISSTRNPAQQRTTNTLLPSSFINNNKKEQESGSSPSNTDIEALSEELLRKDFNNAAKFITVNIQERTTFQSKDDKAPEPLFIIPDKVWNMPTIQKFLPLLDNYERDTTINEYVTPQERNEENAFMDAIMSTSVIRHLMNFFKERGYVTPDPKQQRDFLKQLWFSLYARSRGKLSSSGFEHIFVSELKNGEVSGLHNWIYFAKQESANKINYLGYQKYLQLNDKGAILKLKFIQQGADKPVDEMFIGTSPELEVALYTLCFVTRADKECKIKLSGKSVNIVTHTFRYRSKNLIGSAYPQI